jgi:hypothetical protein
VSGRLCGPGLQTIPVVSYKVLKKYELSVTSSTECLVTNLVAMDKQPCARFEYSKDSAMAASQNGFCSYKFSIYKKTNIMQIKTKNIKIFIYIIFYH